MFYYNYCKNRNRWSVFYKAGKLNVKWGEKAKCLNFIIIVLIGIYSIFLDVFKWYLSGPRSSKDG